jgi:hypothetical protein
MTDGPHRPTDDALITSANAELAVPYTSTPTIAPTTTAVYTV